MQGNGRHTSILLPHHRTRIINSSRAGKLRVSLLTACKVLRTCVGKASSAILFSHTSFNPFRPPGKSCRLNVSIGRSNYIPFILLVIAGFMQFLFQLMVGILFLSRWRTTASRRVMHFTGFQASVPTALSTALPSLPLLPPCSPLQSIPALPQPVAS